MDSTMSLNIMVPLIEKYTFLGISTAGQGNECGDGVVCVVSVMKAGATAAGGSVDLGDMLLQAS